MGHARFLRLCPFGIFGQELKLAGCTHADIEAYCSGRTDGASQGGVSAAVRLDFLGNGTAALASEVFTTAGASGEREGAPGGAGAGELWGGSAAAWPAPASATHRGEFRFSDESAVLQFAVGSGAPAGWAGPERRLRLSVIVRAGVGPAVAMQAALTEDC